jgi:hypothetical protein
MEKLISEFFVLPLKQQVIYSICLFLLNLVLFGFGFLIYHDITGKPRCPFPLPDIMNPNKWH